MEINKIVLDKIWPGYIDRENINGSELWNRQIRIQKGEKVYVIAASGKGKSSLIHFIYLLRKNYAGDILFGRQKAKELTSEQISSIRQEHISIVFQDLRLFPQQTLFENINIKRILKPFYSSNMISEMAEQLGIEQQLHNQAQQCSYGEQQRAAILRALMQPFSYLLLDEPFSHLDEENKEKAMLLLQQECEKRGAAMIFAGLGEEGFTQEGRIIKL